MRPLPTQQAPRPDRATYALVTRAPIAHGSSKSLRLGTDDVDCLSRRVGRAIARQNHCIHPAFCWYGERLLHASTNIADGFAACRNALVVEPAFDLRVRCNRYVSGILGPPCTPGSRCLDEPDQQTKQRQYEHETNQDHQPARPRRGLIGSGLGAVGGGDRTTIRPGTVRQQIATAEPCQRATRQHNVTRIDGV